jgi:hypothetical protein
MTPNFGLKSQSVKLLGMALCFASLSSTVSYAAGVGGKEGGRPEALRAAQTAEIARDAAKAGRSSNSRDSHLRLTAVVARKLSRLSELRLSPNERVTLMHLLASGPELQAVNEILDNPSLAASDKAEQIYSKIAPVKAEKTPTLRLESGVLFLLKDGKYNSILHRDVVHYEFVNKRLVVLDKTNHLYIFEVGDLNVAPWHVSYIQSMAVTGNTLFIQQQAISNDPSIIRALTIDASGTLTHKVVNIKSLEGVRIRRLNTVTLSDGSRLVDVGVEPLSRPHSNHTWLNVLVPTESGEVAIVGRSYRNADLQKFESIP